MGGVITSFTDDWYKTFFGIPSGRVNSMWFIYVLFFVKILDLVWDTIKRKCNWTNRPMIILITLFVIIIQFYPNLYLPRPINWILASFPFYFCGKIVKTYEKKLFNTKTVVKLAVGIALLSVPLLGMRYNGFVDLYSWILGNSVIAYYLVGILSSVGLFYLFSCCLNQENKVIKFLSDGTIMIVALHKLILYFLLGCNSYFLVRICICAFVVLLFYLPIYLSSKYFPLLIGKTNKV